MEKNPGWASDSGNWYAQASEDAREVMRDWLKGILNETVVTVEFIKADGTERSMKCTLSEAFGAKHVNSTTDSTPRKPNPEVCAVWDVTQSAWRSFRWDRLKRIEFTLG